jgi:hypothetical protein
MARMALHPDGTRFYVIGSHLDVHDGAVLRHWN